MVVKTRRSSENHSSTITVLNQSIMQNGGERRRSFLARFRAANMRQSRQNGKNCPSSHSASSDPPSDRSKESARIESTNDIREQASARTSQSEDCSVVSESKRIVVSVEQNRHYRGTNESDNAKQNLENLSVAPQENNEIKLPCANNNPCATAVLQHSYLEHICGYLEGEEVTIESTERKLLRESAMCSSNHVSEMTVKESIECMFASQLQEGLPESFLESCDSDENVPATLSTNAVMFAPSTLAQSLEKSRSRFRIDNPLYPIRSPKNSSTPDRNRKILHASVIHIGTFDPSVSQQDEPSVDSRSEISTVSIGARSSAVSCICGKRFTPSLDPGRWPQRPLLLRPTPGSGTIVKGVRFAKASDYIWDGRNTMTPWSLALRKSWGQGISADDAHDLQEMCPHCMILPINNGNETLGEALVADFESDLFEGTILVRIRGAEGTTKDPYDDTKGYFSDVHRKYQAVVQGRFKHSIPWTECMSGIRLERPCGKLPSKWIIKSAMNVIRFFAPQLDACIDGPHPYSLTPLGSTPQSLIVQSKSADDIVDISQSHSEPTDESRTLLNKASSSVSALQRARQRKKAFDKLFIDKDKEFVTNPDSVYTFEFLQHLIQFDDFSIDLGSMFGSIYLSDVLDGQPIQIRACHNDRNLWSFDVWHESLYAASLLHEHGSGAKTNGIQT